MLDKYTLEAVFSLPTEMFYPGAAAVACCMIFDLSQKHERSNKDHFLDIIEMINSSNVKVWEELNKLMQVIQVCG